MMKTVIFVVLLAVVSAEQFKVKDCALLELEGQVDISAQNNSVAVGTPVSLKFADASVLNESDCKTIKLKMSESVQVWFQVVADGSNQNVQPIAAFTPSEVFTTSPDNSSVVFQAAKVGSFLPSQSFMCTAQLSHVFTTSANTTLSYTVKATTDKLEIQFGSIINETFATNKSDCSQDVTTQPTTASTTSATTKAPSPAPAPVLFSGNVTNGNVTCINLEGEFVIGVTVNSTTHYVNVPVDAVPSGNCSFNASMQSMEITFLKDWKLGFLFSKSGSDDDTTISIAQISVTYDTAVFQAESNVAVAAAQTVVVDKKDFLESKSGGYYLCNSNSTIAEQNGVTVSSSNLKYKAFNTKNSGIDGDVSECPADEETDSVVPIAVGAALAGLVVIVLIAYLIGRRRARKTGYESV